jgi:hypothetical protein
MCKNEGKSSHHTSYPSAHKYKALFSLLSIVTLSLSLLDQAHALFFLSSYIYIVIYTYVRCVQAVSLSRTKKKLFSFFFSRIHTDDREKK